MSPGQPLFFRYETEGNIEDRGETMVTASPTFPALQAASMSAYTVCVGETLKQNQYSDEK